MIPDLLRVLASLIACLACAFLAHFFARRRGDPVFRAFALFFGVSAGIYLGVLLTESVVDVAAGAYARWRPVAFRGGQAATLVYLAWVLRPNGRRR